MIVRYDGRVRVDEPAETPGEAGEGASPPVGATLRHDSGAGWWLEVDGRRISMKTYRMGLLKKLAQARGLTIVSPPKENDG